MTKPTSNRPDFIAYAVSDARRGEKARWKEIGVFYNHEDGQGGTILLDAIPVNGRVVLRVPDAKNGEAHAAAPEGEQP